MKFQCYPLKRGLTTVIKLHFFLQISDKMLLWEIYGVESTHKNNFDAKNFADV